MPRVNSRFHWLHFLAVTGLWLGLSQVFLAGPQVVKATDLASGPVAKVLPDRMRGTAVLFGQNDFDPTTEVPRWASYGMNTVRLMINADSVDNNGQTRFIVPGGNCVDASGVPIQPAPTADNPTAPYTQVLARLDATLEQMRIYGLKAVIVVGYVYCRGTPGYWEDIGKPLRDHVVQLWSVLSKKYASDPVVVAYDMLNEPDQEFVLNGTNTPQNEYDAYNKEMVPEMVAAIRANDPNTYLVVEPAPMALPVGYNKVGGFGQQPVVNDPAGRIIYSFHDYNPATYTVQSQNSLTSQPVSYPGMARNNDEPSDTYWDKTALKAYFQPVRDFQLANNARIYVGEFGAERWAPGVAQFYSDSIAIFEEYGWDWTFHSMGNSSEWNATFAPGDTQVGAPYGDVMTDRLQVLLNGWGLNPHSSFYGTVRLPYPVDGPYFTDFSGATDIYPQHGEGAGTPPGWKQVPAPGSPAASSTSTSTVFLPTPVTMPQWTTYLVHNLGMAAPSANPTYLAYGRNTYGFGNGKTLYVQAKLDPGTTPGTASHLLIRDAADNLVDAYVLQDGTVSYHIKDGSFDTGQVNAGVFTPGAAVLRFEVTATDYTLYRNGVKISNIAHAFANISNYSLQLAGTSTAPVATDNVLAYADDVVITNNVIDLPALPDLEVTGLTATQDKPKYTVLSATIANIGTADAKNFLVRFLDGSTVIGDSGPVSLLPKGSSLTVSFNWNTKDIAGEHTLTVIADPTNAVAELNESNNTYQQVFTIRGNKVANGSFENGSANTGPDNWSGTPGTSYDTTGTNATDGSRAVGASGNGVPAAVNNPTWASATIPVTSGQTYNLAMTVKTETVSSAPSLQIVFLDAAGNIICIGNSLSGGIIGTSTAQTILGQVTIPPGISQVQLKLVAFSPNDLATQGNIWFDDIWFW